MENMFTYYMYDQVPTELCSFVLIELDQACFFASKRFLYNCPM